MDAELESPNFATKLNFVVTMTDFEYILEQCRQFNEIFVDEEFVNHGIHGYDNVISIKSCRNFWDADCKRISAIDYILNVCGVAPQFIGLDAEVVKVADYELEPSYA